MDKNNFLEYIYALLKMMVVDAKVKYNLDWSEGALQVSTEDAVMFEIEMKDDGYIAFQFASGQTEFDPKSLTPNEYVILMDRITEYPAFMWRYLKGITETCTPEFDLPATVRVDILRLHKSGNASAKVLEAMLIVKAAESMARQEDKDTNEETESDDSDDEWEDEDDFDFVDDDSDEGNIDSDTEDGSDAVEGEPEVKKPSPFKFIEHSKEVPHFKKYYLKTQHIFKMLNALNKYVVSSNKAFRPVGNPAFTQIKYLPQNSDAMRLAFSCPHIETTDGNPTVFYVAYPQSYMSIDVVFEVFKDALIEQFITVRSNKRQTKILHMLRKSKDLIDFLSVFEVTKNMVY